MRKSSILWLSKGIQFLLTEIITVSIVYNIFPAFSINPWLSSNFGVIILCSTIPLLILNLCFFSTKSSLISLSIGIILTIAGIILAKNAGIFSNSTNFEFSYSFYVIILITSIFTFIASRFRLALIILFVATVIIFASLTVLAYRTNWIFLAVFLMCTAILYSFEFYFYNIKLSHAKKSMPFRYILISCFFCFACAALSAGIYSIVQAGNLPVQKPSILSNPTFLQLGKKYGFATLVKAPPQSVKQLREIQKNSVNTNSTNDNKPTQQKVATSADNNLKDQQQTVANNSSHASSSIDKNKGNKKEEIKVKPITYLKKLPIALIVVGIITVFVLIFVFKKLFRTVWYKNLLKTDKNNQVIQLYSHILKILSRFGYKRMAADTPFEFANSLYADKNSISFEQSDFIQVTDIFTKINYGENTVTNDDYNKVVSFYKSILSYCRKDAGLFKFVIKYLLV